MADEFHDHWKVVPFDLNKKPKEDPDAYVIGYRYGSVQGWPDLHDSRSKEQG